MKESRKQILEELKKELKELNRLKKVAKRLQTRPKARKKVTRDQNRLRKNYGTFGDYRHPGERRKGE